MTHSKFEIFRLIHSPPNDVFAWLKENQPKDKGSHKVIDRETLEKELLQRDDPLINLGLALYGCEYNTGWTLYQQKNDRTIKEALLAGNTVASMWVQNEGVLKDLLEKGGFEDRFLSHFFSNERIKDDLLEALYKKTEPFDKLNDQDWYLLIAFTIDNPRISTPYDDTYLDGFREYNYNKVFSAAWELFEIFPVNRETAGLLSSLSENLIPSSVDFDAMEIIERWRVNDPDDTFDSFETCRINLAGLIHDIISLKDSTDIALRKSYYRRFTAYKPENIRGLFEKDKDRFLDEALWNESLFRKEDIRDELSKCCWDCEDPNYHMDYPNFYTARIQYYEKERPEWFEDVNEDPLLDEHEDQITKVNELLELLNSKMDDFTETVNDVKYDINDTLKRGNEDLSGFFDELRMTLSQFNPVPLQQPQQNNISWGLILISLIVGYSLAKFI